MQANTGRGMQLQLLDWLEELTFPEESKFQDVEYAKAMYASAVDRYLRYGTTPACQCDPVTGDCGEQCMNRMMQIVCTPRTCPCGPRCTNGSLGKRAAPELEIVEVRKRD